MPTFRLAIRRSGPYNRNLWAWEGLRGGGERGISRQGMSRSGLTTIFVNLWVATAAVSLLVMVIFTLIVWPREASTEEKLAGVQVWVESLELQKQGYRSHRERDLPRAIELYNATLEKRPEFVRVFYLRGLARMALGDKEGAIEDFSKTLALVPNFPGAHNSRGVVRYEQGDIEGALDDFDQSMKAMPWLADPYVNRGQIRRELGQIEDALGDYDVAIELNPFSAWAFESRGVLKFESGDLTGAMADFDAAVDQLKYWDRNFNCLANRAALREALGDSQGAAEDLARYQKLHSEYAASP